MKQLGNSVLEHLLETQRETPAATGAFTRLFNELIVAAKLIAREVSQAGLVGLYSYSDNSDPLGRRMRRVDDYATNVLVQRLSSSGEVCLLASDTSSDPIIIDRNLPRGGYVVVFDAIDNSDNLESNASVGTIFSIYRRVSTRGDDGVLQDVLQAGREQVAAGYFLYGSSTVLVYTAGKDVNGFTLDPSVGEFLLSNENITIPESGLIYSINESNYSFWDEGVRRYIDWLRTPVDGQSKGYTLRYMGDLVSDFHRNLISGGIFLYPADSRDTRKLSGKLRLVAEANPLAMVVEAAGGAASTGRERILDVQPTDIHQRIPLLIGSREEVALAEEFITGARQ